MFLFVCYLFILLFFFFFSSPRAGVEPVSKQPQKAGFKVSDDSDVSENDEDEVVVSKPVLRHRQPMFVRHAVQWIPEPIKSSLK